MHLQHESFSHLIHGRFCTGFCDHCERLLLSTTPAVPYTTASSHSTATLYRKNAEPWSAVIQQCATYLCYGRKLWGGGAGPSRSASCPGWSGSRLTCWLPHVAELSQVGYSQLLRCPAEENAPAEQITSANEFPWQHVNERPQVLLDCHSVIATAALLRWTASPASPRVPPRPPEA